MVLLFDNIVQRSISFFISDIHIKNLSSLRDVDLETVQKCLILSFPDRYMKRTRLKWVNMVGVHSQTDSFSEYLFTKDFVFLVLHE